MKSLIINPYQCELIARVTDKRLEGKYSHVSFSDSIFPLYSDLAIPIEDGCIGSSRLIRVYMDGDKPVHVFEGKADSPDLKMQVSYKKRLLNIRDIGLRLVISYALAFLYNRKPYDFKSRDSLNKRICTFSIDGHFTYADTEDMIKNLTLLVQKLVSSGLMIKSKPSGLSVKTSLFGIFTCSWIGPHVAFSSEIGSFVLSLDEIGENNLTMSFELNH